MLNLFLKIVYYWFIVNDSTLLYYLRDRNNNILLPWGCLKDSCYALLWIWIDLVAKFLETWYTYLSLTVETINFELSMTLKVCIANLDFLWLPSGEMFCAVFLKAYVLRLCPVTNYFLTDGFTLVYWTTHHV